MVIVLNPHGQFCKKTRLENVSKANGFKMCVRLLDNFCMRFKRPWEYLASLFVGQLCTLDIRTMNQQKCWLR